MPVSLTSLPDELLKSIVEWVQDSYKAWRELGLSRGAFGEESHVAAGRWSSWYYGRGLFAVAHVNKRLHAVAQLLLSRVRSQTCRSASQRSSADSPSLLTRQSRRWSKIDTTFFKSRRTATRRGVLAAQERRGDELGGREETAERLRERRERASRARARGV